MFPSVAILAQANQLFRAFELRPTMTNAGADGIQTSSQGGVR
jgi:hypothetical protein